jgi:hypothetical protein
MAPATQKKRRETWSQRVGCSKHAVSPVNEQLTPHHARSK